MSQDTHEAHDATRPEASFDLLTDDGLDTFPDLETDIPIVPFGLHFGGETFDSTGMPMEELFRRLKSDGPHPTTSQPTPEAFAEHYRRAERPLLVVTLSAALSGSRNSAEQARALVPEADVEIHDARTLSAAQAFQLHAASLARAAGQTRDAAIEAMKSMHEATELFFTLDTLEYLRKGGRIGRVQAALGNVLNLKPAVTVDKDTAAYETVGRARTWSKARSTLADLVTKKFGEGTAIRVGLVQGEDVEDAMSILEQLRARHPIAWHGVAKVGSALAIHTGPRAVALAAAPATLPWTVGDLA